METIEKYSRIEYERRWVVRLGPGWMDLTEPYSKRLHDRYIDNSRLRLRHQVDTDTGREVWKLTKKYFSDSPFRRQITSIVLDAAEAELMSRPPSHEIAKTRFYRSNESGTFAIDIFEGELETLTICEIECDDLASLMQIPGPPYASVEVTTDEFFTGGNLCRITGVELETKLDRIL